MIFREGYVYIKDLAEYIENGKIQLAHKYTIEKNIPPHTSKINPSLFVESVLLGVPLQSFYFILEERGDLIFIDGLERITVLYNFLKDNFKLEGLEYYKDNSLKRYSELPRNLQRKLEETRLHFYILDTTDENIQQSVFKRLQNKAGECF